MCVTSPYEAAACELDQFATRTRTFFWCGLDTSLLIMVATHIEPYVCYRPPHGNYRALLGTASGTASRVVVLWGPDRRCTSWASLFDQCALSVSNTA